MGVILKTVATTLLKCIMALRFRRLIFKMIVWKNETLNEVKG